MHIDPSLPMTNAPATVAYISNPGEEKGKSSKYILIFFGAASIIATAFTIKYRPTLANRIVIILSSLDPPLITAFIGFTLTSYAIFKNWRPLMNNLLNPEPMSPPTTPEPGANALTIHPPRRFERVLEEAGETTGTEPIEEKAEKKEIVLVGITNADQLRHIFGDRIGSDIALHEDGNKLIIKVKDRSGRYREVLGLDNSATDASAPPLLMRVNRELFNHGRPDHAGNEVGSNQHLGEPEHNYIQGILKLLNGIFESYEGHSIKFSSSGGLTINFTINTKPYTVALKTRIYSEALKQVDVVLFNEKLPDHKGRPADSPEHGGHPPK